MKLKEFPEAYGVMSTRGPKNSRWQHCRICRRGCYDTSEPSCEHILAYRARAHSLETDQPSPRS